MRIAFLGFGLGPRGAEGARNQSWGLAKALAERGHEIDIVTTVDGHTNGSPKGVEIHAVPMSGPSWTAASFARVAGPWARAVSLVLDRRRPDVVHGHHRALPLASVDRLIDLRQAALVETQYAAFYDGAFRDLLVGPPVSILKERLPHALVNRRALARAAIGPQTHLHAFTRAGARELSEAFPGRPVSIVPPGVDANAFSTVERTSGRELRVLFAGHLTFTKGAHLLPRIFQHVAKRADHVRFTIAESGAGTWRPRLADSLRKRGLLERTDFVGRAELPTLFASHDVLVAPRPRAYGTMQPPLTLIEAAAAGLPVVTSRLPGSDEVVLPNETGLLVPPNDPERTAEAITDLLEDEPLRAAMASCGRRVARARHDWSVVAPAMEQVYAEAIR